MTANPKPLVFYHRNCWDGFCAAWVARKHFGDIDSVAVQYGERMPSVEGRDVFILDFSYSRQELLLAKKCARSLLVLDHHKTAEAELRSLNFCVFDMNKSGARLAWEFFFASSNAPWLVDYTEDRDLWRHALPNSEEINAALRSYELSFPAWDELENRIPAELVGEGAAIRRMERRVVQDHVKNIRTVTIGGVVFHCVNATTLYSEIAGEIAKGKNFGACYFDRADGKRQWSLRSTGDGVDVSEIAERFGGGGHEHAAGFEQTIEP